METTALTILGKIGECLAAPVGRQFGYLFHLNSNIKTLIDDVEKLKNIRHSIEMRVQAALNNVENIELIVDKWLVDSHKVVEEADIIIQGKAELPEGCFSQWCLNLKPLYALSRNAKKKTVVVMKLIQEGQFGNISCPAPLIPFLASSSSTRNFDTRKSILDEIIRILTDDKINMIGICGMGGVGKTTMAEEIRKRVVKEKLFDDCAMAVISQKQDFAKIQSDIAEMLGLKLDEQNPIARKDKLHQRLEKDRVLVILDDLWAQFDLNVLGITFAKGCKVLFTSRVQNLWRGLETKIDIKLGVLEESEAWDLFEAKVGDSLKNEPELRPLAKEIVKECGGLPLALVTIGSALIGKSIHSWRHIRDRLKTGCPSKVPGVPAEVYQSIKLSYDYLEEEKNPIFFGDCKEMKSLFLLCCLFEEDFDIPVDDLVKMGQGLRLFIGANGLEQARDRVFALLEQLKSRYLLLPGREIYDAFLDRMINSNERVRMHDVVRDVAKSIAAEEKGALILDHGTVETVWQEQDMVNNFTWISVISKEISKLPIELRSSQIKLLRCTNGVLQIADDFFEGMEELEVLYISGMKGRKLPSLLRLPSSVRMLYFRECDLKNTTFVGDLRNLEILDLGQSKIKEWPIELVCLSSLVSVDLRECGNLKTVPAGIISRLRQLEELYIGESRIDWVGKENEEGRNANIKEFELLTNKLHTLHIWIKDASILPTSPLFSNLNKYKIQIGGGYRMRKSTYEKCCSISLPTFVPLKGDIEFLSKNSEYLHLEGEYAKDLVHELVQDGFQSLKCLILQRIDTLEQISRSPLMLGSFGKLKHLEVTNCNKLRNVFQLSIVAELIWGERDDNATNKLVFPKLERLVIYFLPRLISFCRGIDEIEFPQLKSLILSKLPQHFFPPKVSFPALEELELRYLDSMEVLCGQYLQGGSFLNLTQIDVYGCNEIRSVLTHFMARYLVHLRKLNISKCSLLEVVVAKEEEGDDRENTIILPSLKYVFLVNLPTLKSFCDVAHDLKFTMLSFIHIRKCPEIMTFSPAPVSTPNLNNVTLDVMGPRTLWMEELNTTIMHLHQHELEFKDDDDDDDDTHDDDDDSSDDEGGDDDSSGDDGGDDNKDDDARLHLSNKEPKIG